MNEYELLRAEILNIYEMVTQYNCVLFTTVAAILAFALENSNFVICMLPYLVILPIHFMCEDRYKAMCKIGAYMYVFLERKEYYWESRSLIRSGYEKSRDSRNEESRLWRIHLHYYGLSLISSILSLSLLMLSPYRMFLKILFSSLIIVISALSIYFIRINTTDFPVVREFYVRQWEKVKREEQSFS